MGFRYVAVWREVVKSRGGFRIGKSPHCRVKEVKQFLNAFECELSSRRIYLIITFLELSSAQTT